MTWLNLLWFVALTLTIKVDGENVTLGLNEFTAAFVALLLGLCEARGKSVLKLSRFPVQVIPDSEYVMREVYRFRRKQFVKSQLAAVRVGRGNIHRSICHRIRGALMVQCHSSRTISDLPDRHVFVFGHAEANHLCFLS
jgi:hypothetical protein